MNSSIAERVVRQDVRPVVYLFQSKVYYWYGSSWPESCTCYGRDVGEVDRGAVWKSRYNKKQRERKKSVAEENHGGHGREARIRTQRNATQIASDRNVTFVCVALRCAAVLILASRPVGKLQSTTNTIYRPNRGDELLCVWLHQSCQKRHARHGSLLLHIFFFLSVFCYICSSKQHLYLLLLHHDHNRCRIPVRRSHTSSRPCSGTDKQQDGHLA